MSASQQTDRLQRLIAKLTASGRALGEVMDGQIHRGQPTGLDEAFLIDKPTRDRLAIFDPSCARFIKRILRTTHLRPWYQADEGHYIIALPDNWTATTFEPGLSEAEAWSQLAARHPSIAKHLLPFEESARNRQHKGAYWWELPAYDADAGSARPKIVWPCYASQPCCSWEDKGLYVDQASCFLIPQEPYILGLMQSRVSWLYISELCQQLDGQAGTPQYQQDRTCMARLPIPDTPAAERAQIGEAVMRISELARARYELHQTVRRRILADWAPPGSTLSQPLANWWLLDLPDFHGELNAAFRNNIPLRYRDAWETWLTRQRTEHERYTAEIAQIERDLNARVYDLFALTAQEIALVEEHTRYGYGEV